MLFRLQLKLVNLLNALQLNQQLSLQNGNIKGMFSAAGVLIREQQEMQPRKHLFLRDKDTLADVGNSSKSEALSVLLPSARD